MCACWMERDVKTEQERRIPSLSPNLQVGACVCVKREVRGDDERREERRGRLSLVFQAILSGLLSGLSQLSC